MVVLGKSASVTCHPNSLPSLTTYFTEATCHKNQKQRFNISNLQNRITIGHASIGFSFDTGKRIPGIGSSAISSARWKSYEWFTRTWNYLWSRTWMGWMCFRKDTVCPQNLFHIVSWYTETIMYKIKSLRTIRQYDYGDLECWLSSMQRWSSQRLIGRMKEWSTSIVRFHQWLQVNMNKDGERTTIKAHPARFTYTILTERQMKRSW